VSLVRSRPAEDGDSQVLRARVSELEALLADHVAELARVKSGLTAFKATYRERVGWLHEELDELERAIAEAELDELSKRLHDEPQASEHSVHASQPEAPSRYASDAVRRLFRDVAKAIHPDLAMDELARDRRHTLMIEANRAYAVGDEERLRWILRSWERSPETVEASDGNETRLRLTRRVAQLEEQLALVTGDLAALKESPMWRLKAMVDDAAANGKDLVREMTDRLKVDIMVARNRLDAMQSTP
jgi:hypothetical protein